MTNQQLTPTQELLNQWCYASTGDWREIAAIAARWGADQELEACCKWLPKLPPWSADDLRRHRRPKPPSLKEQALDQLRRVNAVLQFQTDGSETSVIRRALESLSE